MPLHFEGVTLVYFGAVIVIVHSVKYQNVHVLFCDASFIVGAVES